MKDKDVALNTQFSIYLSYFTDRDDEANFYRLLQNYTNIGTEIFAYLIDWEKMDGFPKFRLYVPADHEVFVHSAYKSGFLTKGQITTINCKIIENCDLLIFFGQHGCSPIDGKLIWAETKDGHIVEEIECAKQKEVPIYTMPDLSPMAIDALKLAVKLIIKSGD